MATKDLFQLIIKVLTDLRVIGTVVVMLLIVEFAKYIANYTKKPKRPKPKKEAAPAPAAEETSEDSEE